MIFSLLLLAATFVIIISHSIYLMSRIDATIAHQDNAWRLEVCQRRNAEQEALKMNIDDAVYTLQQQRPDLAARIVHAGELLHTRLAELPEEACASRGSSGFEPYRQQNPNLSKRWPNWHIRRVSAEEILAP